MRDINHLLEHLKKSIETGEPFFPQEHDIEMLERYINLSAEPSDDLISRKETLKELKQWFHSKGWMLSDEDVESILWELSPAKPEWIQCSERLPETMSEYLITVLSNPSKNPITSAAFYSTLRKEFGTFEPFGEWEKWDAVAWMPLPKPYRKDGKA